MFMVAPMLHDKLIINCKFKLMANVLIERYFKSGSNPAGSFTFQAANALSVINIATAKPAAGLKFSRMIKRVRQIREMSNKRL